VLPALSAASPADVLAAIAAVRASLEDDDDALEAWLAEMVDRPRRGEAYDLAALGGRPRALARRAIFRWLGVERLAGNLSRPAVEVLVEAVHSGGEARSSAGRGVLVVVHHGVLSREEFRGSAATPGGGWGAARLDVGSALGGPNGSVLRLCRRRLDRELYESIVGGRFPPVDTVFLAPGPGWPGWFTVRSWEPGDRYRPLGGPGRAKLQDLFVDRKIPRDARGRLPVVCMPGSGNPVWVPGIPPAADLAVGPGHKLVLQLTYHSPGNNLRR
jgi:tRNA(Ile)-lysidine synthetase-like protein